MTSVIFRDTGSGSIDVKVPGVANGVYDKRTSGLLIPRDAGVQLKVGKIIKENALHDFIVVNGKKILVLKESFKVNSDEFRESVIGGIKVKMSEDGNVVEILEGDLKGIQFFTKKGVVKILEKNGYRLPSFDEIEDFLKRFGKQYFLDKLYGGIKVKDNEYLLIWQNHSFIFWLESGSQCIIEEEASSNKVSCMERNFEDIEFLPVLAVKELKK